MISRALVIAGLLAGCTDDPFLEVTGGTAERGEIRPGDTLTVRAHFPSGVFSCGAWYVNAIAGGSPELGTIDRCGQYQAPGAFPPGLVELVIEGVFVGASDASTSADVVAQSFVPAQRHSALLRALPGAGLAQFGPCPSVVARNWISSASSAVR